MQFLHRRIVDVRARAIVCLVALMYQCFCLSPAYAADGVDPNLVSEYRNITKRLLLAAVELERFSLTFRLESARQPRWRRLRYFLAQETGAAGIMAFEIIAVDQFNVGRKHPLKIDIGALKGGLRTALVTSIIAGSGSCLELASNTVHAIENKRRGYDSQSANKYVLERKQLIDSLMAERETFVNKHSDHPYYPVWVAEGKVLRELRSAFIYEYSQFHSDMRGYGIYENLFYAINIASNAVGATAAHYGVKALTDPKYNGTSNVLFIVAGSLGMAAPLLSSALGGLARKYDYYRLTKLLKEKPQYDPAAVAAATKELQAAETAVIAQGHEIAALNSQALVTESLYVQSAHLFKKQLDSETRAVRRFNKVAVQSNILGPAIGGTLFTQGLLGTIGYYRYGMRPRKQLTLAYRGSVVGLTGASVAVAATAAGLLADWYYVHRHKKKKRLPPQLIEERLKHLEEVEKTVNAL